MTIKIDNQGHTADGSHQGEVLAAVVRDLAKLGLETAAVTDLVNNLGGVADAEGDIVGYQTAFVNVADAGTTSAGKAATEAAFGTVRDGLEELVAKANALAAGVSVPALTSSMGGAVADGTAAAVTVAVTAALTGVQATESNAFRAAVNQAIWDVARQVNKVAAAVGVAQLDITMNYAYRATIPALSLAGGTAADPGVSKAAADAALAQWQIDLTTIATKLAAINAVSFAAPAVRVE